MSSDDRPYRKPASPAMNRPNSQFGNNLKPPDFSDLAAGSRTERLQECKHYLLWARMYMNRTFFGLIVASGEALRCADRHLTLPEGSYHTPVLGYPALGLTNLEP